MAQVFNTTPIGERTIGWGRCTIVMKEIEIKPPPQPRFAIVDVWTRTMMNMSVRNANKFSARPRYGWAMSWLIAKNTKNTKRMYLFRE